MTGAKIMNEILKISKNPNLINLASLWFHEKWGIPIEAYRASMEASIKGDPIQEWFFILNDGKIIAGMGVIENDFHERKDLAPNIVAVYVEEKYRRHGLAGKLLNYVVDDCKKREITPMYLVTDHIGFYERYGWEFLTLVRCDGEDKLSRIYVHK